ncbi:hypothetical protein HPULCUR_003709 [Helicostylum pulchrum]|uniref:Uncharacterized protein n=1 Tax=Helicostylum pulchrum TaxID=562976 RepID=A0ABP9XVP0_9FUNG
MAIYMNEKISMTVESDDDQVLPNSLLIERFLLALPQKVAEYINVAIVNLPEYKRQDIEVLSDLARRLQNSTLFTMRANTMVAPLMPPRAPKRAAMHIDQNDAVHRSSNRSRHAVNLARAAAPTGTTTGESSSSAAVSVVPQPTDKYCTFHKAKSHNTSECRAAAAAGTNVKPRVKYCHGCGVAGWNPRHECATAKRTSPPLLPNTNQEYNFGAMTLQQGSNVVGPANTSSAVPSVPSVPFVPSAVSSASVTTSRAELQAAYNAGVADATADIQELSIADDEDVIMDIQAQNCKYHNVFSSLPENNKNNCTIPILIGLDLISKLNIGITGLALSHTELAADNPFSDPPIDPSISEPNNSPYGTIEERIEMKKLLEPVLLANKNIDVKNTYCTLPGAIVYLETKPGCIAYRKSYSLLIVKVIVFL